MRRKIYKMICVAVACMSLTACDSWLDVDPSDRYSTETFWKTKEHASAGIMGCYNALKPWRSLHTMEFDMLTANAMPYNEANGTQAFVYYGFNRKLMEELLRWHWPYEYFHR